MPYVSPDMMAAGTLGDDDEAVLYEIGFHRCRAEIRRSDAKKKKNAGVADLLIERARLDEALADRIDAHRAEQVKHGTFPPPKRARSARASSSL